VKETVMKTLWVVLMVFVVSCAPYHRDSGSNLPRTCVVLTNAINQEDWATLRKLVKPGMLGNNYGTRFEGEIKGANPAPKTHLDYIVGRFLMVQAKLGTNGKTNQVYSFQLENKNGTVNPHWLQITLREEHGRSELVDFWNFGW
jgi:hypothetical protein